MAWKKGESGNPKGLGADPDDIRSIARGLFDAAYWQRTKARLDDGKLSPALEIKLLSYAYKDPDADLHHSGLTVHIGFLPNQAQPRTIDVVPIPKALPRATTPSATSRDKNGKGGTPPDPLDLRKP